MSHDFRFISDKIRRFIFSSSKFNDVVFKFLNNSFKIDVFNKRNDEETSIIEFKNFKTFFYKNLESNFIVNTISNAYITHHSGSKFNNDYPSNWPFHLKISYNKRKILIKLRIVLINDSFKIFPINFSSKYYDLRKFEDKVLFKSIRIILSFLNSSSFISAFNNSISAYFIHNFSTAHIFSISDFQLGNFTNYHLKIDHKIIKYFKNCDFFDIFHILSVTPSDKDDFISKFNYFIFNNPHKLYYLDNDFAIIIDII